MKWLWPTLTAGIAANGIRLRRRIASLQVLPADDPGCDFGDHRLVTAAGVHVDGATARAGSAYARANALDVLDLVPADLSVDQLFELVRLADPRSYRSDPLVTGRSAGHAMIVSSDVVRRARADRLDGLEPAALVGLAARLKRHAPRSTDMVIAPGLRASVATPGAEAARRRETYGFLAGGVALVQAAELTVLARAASRRRPWGLAAAAAFSLQPVVATAGTASQPHDLIGRSLLRLPTTIVMQVRSMIAARASRTESANVDDSARQRKEYEAMLADGVEALFEPRRDDCPLCGSSDLSVRIRTQDHVQGKPGEFVLEECGACGHVFQNPRLTIEGLDFYYRDFYDGVGETELELVFSTGQTSYDGRVGIVEPHTTPKRWLDVGTGHGHFCLIARGRWPEASFDGLDLGDGVEEAERRGWIDVGYRGLFPELADSLRGQYDVVSMHHYLEHTREPGDELDAAATVLSPGGYLLIELPDASSPLARKLGKWWGPYFQPQHQHMVSVENLQRLLHDRGFQVVAVERREAHQPCDFAFGAYLVLNRFGPARDVPWMAPPTLGGKVRRGAVFALGSPLLALGLIADQVGEPLVARVSPSAFRVLARKN